MIGSFFGATTFNDTKPVYASSDNGESWSFRSNVTGIYWANLFAQGSAVYMLGTAGDDIHRLSPPQTKPMKGGPVVITKSTDSGHSWTVPSVLLHGSFQTGPTPTISVNGTLFRTMEDSATTPYPGAFVMWAPATSDLTSAASWSRSNAIGAPPSPKGHVDWQEGSAVHAPSGEVWNVLRVNGQSAAFNNVAGATVLDTAAKTLRFKQWIHGPFSTSKFVIRRDEAASDPHYYAVATNVTESAIKLGQIGARNNLVLA